MQDLPEYKALEDEEDRKAAFAKYIKRQKVSLTSPGVSITLMFFRRSLKKYPTMAHRQPVASEKSLQTTIPVKEVTETEKTDTKIVIGSANAVIVNETERRTDTVIVIVTVTAEKTMTRTDTGDIVVMIMIETREIIVIGIRIATEIGRIGTGIGIIIKTEESIVIGLFACFVLFLC